MILNRIQKIFTEHRRESALLPSTEESPLPRLLLNIGGEQGSYALVIEITAARTSVPATLAREKEPHPLHRLECIINYPFSVREGCGGQVASLLHFLNHTLELPGFEFDELHDHVRYRYVLFVRDQWCDAPFLEQLAGQLELPTTILLDTIEAVCLGRKTFNKFLEEIVEVQHELLAFLKKRDQT